VKAEAMELAGTAAQGAGAPLPPPHPTLSLPRSHRDLSPAYLILGMVGFQLLTPVYCAGMYSQKKTQLFYYSISIVDQYY
jgi:hypothetical protein